MNRGCLVAVLLCVAAPIAVCGGLAVIGVAVAPTSPRPVATQADHVQMIHHARGFVRESLAPKPTAFPLPESGAYVARDRGAGRWEIAGYVDTVNQFNAPIRRSWSVVLTARNGAVKLESLKWD